MLLEVEKLSTGYGRGMIVHHVSLCVAEGEMVCVIGPNGAGKSTVLRGIAGQISPMEGRILFDGFDRTYQSVGEKARKGLIFIPQGDNVFPNLSVRENLEIAGNILGDWDQLESGIRSSLEKFPVLRERKNRPAGELSGGQRQMLALCRILILNPRLVLLDEPSLGLAPLVVEQIFEEIRHMNREGLSFLLVEQNARKGLSVSHRAYVLELGRNRLSGEGRMLLNNPEVQRLYLGG